MSEKEEVEHQVPHIKVEVEFNGEKISQECAFFVDSIHFLCEAEQAVRRGMGLRRQSVDLRVAEICSENMNKLLIEQKGK